MNIRVVRPPTRAHFSMDHTKRHVGIVRGVIAGMIAAAWLASAAGTSWGEEDFSALVRSARDRFTPISEDQLAAARADLQQRATELLRFVGPHTANGQRWLAYLKWDNFQKQLAEGERPDFEPLVATYQQLNRDENGLELAPYRNLSEALRHYIDLAFIARQPDQAAAYAGQLEALERELDQYRDRPTGAMRMAIGQRLDFVAGLGQAPELVAAVRTEFARPNGLVSVSADLLNASAEPIDRTEPVHDCILGTSIQSTAHSLGTNRVRTVPADDRAVLEITSVGHTASDNTGHNGPAVIRSTAETDFTAVTRVELTDEAFRSHAVNVDASTHSDIHSISKQGGGFGSRLVSQIGWNKARQQHGRADAIASDHAEDRVARRVADETADALGDAWRRYQDEYRLPLARCGDLPEQIRFSTTDDALKFEVTQANRSQLAAPDSPPELPAGNDVVLRLHETAANNYASAILGGVTISESDSAAGTKSDVTLPAWIKDAWKRRMDAKAEESGGANFEPWSLTFRRDQPITAAFDGAKVTLTLHVARLTSGSDDFRQWDVTGTFRPELADGGVTLRREGELTVLPTGFDPDHDRLSSRQVAVRRNLTRVLTERSDEGRGFPQTVQIKPLEPSGKLANAGPLAVGEFTSSDGWLTVTWNRM
jgi:hypothetical protein